jgi:hypothetical protein
MYNDIPKYTWDKGNTNRAEKRRRKEKSQDKIDLNREWGCLWVRAMKDFMAVSKLVISGP